MGIKKPYKRTCRQFTDGHYADSGKSKYLLNKDFAESPAQYIRPFLLIQKDLQNLFDYIEPSEQNSNCYSYRIHELLTRTCIEVEANCKAILTENGYIKNGDLNMLDYKKINISHHLSSYEISLPLWDGINKIRKPFNSWVNNGSLSWYQAYNSTKHNRHNEFKQANFNNLIESVCGLAAILSAQFWQEDFNPSMGGIALEGSHDDMESVIGEYFRVKFPNDWSDDEKYDFTYQEINASDFTIEKYDYNSI